jgi:cytochrome b561
MFELPPLMAANENLAAALFRIHRWIGISIALLAAMHIGAALQHYFIFKDGVLQRMLPRALGGR